MTNDINGAAKPKPKFDEITLLKMIALASVLLFHCYRPFLGEGSFWKVVIDSKADYLTYLYHFNKVFDVHCLFFCSGFLYFMTMAGGNRSVRDQLIKRVRRIVVPYFTVGTLFFIPMYTLFSVPSGLHLADDSLWEGYRKFFCLIFSDHLWFLQNMLIITVICLLLNFMIRKFFPVLLALSFLASYAFYAIPGSVRFMSLCSLTDNLFIFVLGGAVYMYYKYLTPKVNAAIMLSSAVLFLTCYNLQVPKNWLFPAVSMLTAGSASVCALTLARYFASGAMSFLYKSPLIRFYDRNFMGFYMYHMPIPLICALYLYKPFTEHVADSNVLYIIAAWIITFALSAVAVKAGALIKSQCTRIEFIKALYS